MARRAFQTFEMHLQDAGTEGTRVWLPLLVGTDRLGVLGVTVPDGDALNSEDAQLPAVLARFAAMAAELIAAKRRNLVHGDRLLALESARCG